MSQEIDPNSILRLKTVLALTGLSRSTVWRLCREGEFPQSRKLTKRLIGWQAAEILSWLNSRERKAPAFTEAKADSSETHREGRERAPHRRKKPCARKRKSPQAGESATVGSRGRATAHEANGALHKVSSEGDAAGVSTESSCETKEAPR